MATEWITTNRSDFMWPFLAERQRIIDWDNYEYKEQRRENAERSGCSQPSKQSSCEADALQPTKQIIEYNKDHADARTDSVRTRPKVNLYPQINLDEVSDDRRDAWCAFIYSSSKTISELTSGVPQARQISVDDQVPSTKPFTDLVKCRRQPLFKNINPAKNWRRVSIEWDKSQKRIFGGRSVD